MQLQPIQRADDPAQSLARHVGVDCCRLQLAVPQEDLDGPDIDVLLQKGVAKQWRSVCRVTGFLIPARPWASWKARFSEREVTGSKAFRGLGNSHAGGRAIFHQSRKVARS
jgi:hypothetical protein